MKKIILLAMPAIMAFASCTGQKQATLPNSKEAAARDHANHFNGQKQKAPAKKTYTDDVYGTGGSATYTREANSTGGTDHRLNYQPGYYMCDNQPYYWSGNDLCSWNNGTWTMSTYGRSSFGLTLSAGIYFGRAYPYMETGWNYYYPYGYSGGYGYWNTYAGANWPQYHYECIGGQTFKVNHNQGVPPGYVGYRGPNRTGDNAGMSGWNPTGDGGYIGGSGGTYNAPRTSSGSNNRTSSGPRR